MTEQEMLPSVKGDRMLTIERRDNDDGSISYEIWNLVSTNYGFVAAINDSINPRAKEWAELFVRVGNATI